MGILSANHVYNGRPKADYGRVRLRRRGMIGRATNGKLVKARELSYFSWRLA